MEYTHLLKHIISLQPYLWVGLQSLLKELIEMVGEENQHELVWVFSQVVLNEMV